MNDPQPVRLELDARLRLALFVGLERLSDLRGNAAAGQLRLRRPTVAEPAIWVYASTIGELNAIGLLVRQLCTRMPHLRLVLITNHGHYEASYRAQYPHAEVCITLGHGSDAQALGRHYPPRLLVVGEIPCLPSDAPCRFSMTFVAEAKRRGAVAVVVNGWLYGDQPACRMDRIERSLLTRAYVRSFDAICMQTAEARLQMIGAGGFPDRVHVTGNMKFDAMGRADWQVSQSRSAGLLSALLDKEGPIIVAGCVTNDGEQRLVLDAFERLKRAHPAALLVLAPRHPENRERMAALAALLLQAGHRTAFRSELREVAGEITFSCLVLDTMGDLRDFYAAASCAHVGVDHNVLEPLAFGKRVTVAPGWTRNYPSYPVFQLLSDAGLLHVTADPGVLADAWHAEIATVQMAGADSLPVHTLLDSMKGAVARHLEIIERLLRDNTNRGAGRAMA